MNINKRFVMLTCLAALCASAPDLPAQTPTATTSLEEVIVTARKSDEALLRSEEHTSELQSRLHLVCRLLLEKKKTNGSTLCFRPTYTTPRISPRSPRWCTNAYTLHMQTRSTRSTNSTYRSLWYDLTPHPRIR